MLEINEIKDAEMLLKIATKLERWAAESLAGGWSTHQVVPQRKLSGEILSYLARTSRLNVLDKARGEK